MKNLVFFGDSLLANCDKGRILMLEEKLGGEYGVYNCAAGGWDVTDLLKKVDYISKLEPDTVLLSVGTNDASPWKQIALPEFTEKLKKLLKSFGHSPVIYFLPVPIDESRHAPDKMRSNEVQKQYHDAAKQVAEASGVECVDLWQKCADMTAAGQDYLVEDGVHFRDNAYEMIFDEVGRILR